MMKLRIQNNARGGRGIWIGGDLVSLGAGNTQTFEKATAAERDDAISHGDFRVWTQDGGEWVEVTRITDAPVARPFLAVAKGASGENVRYIPLEDGEWYLGTALAADLPDGVGGYGWAKIGGVETTPFDPAKYLTPEEIKHALSPDYREPVSTVKLGGGQEDNFSAAAFVADLAPDVIEGVASLDADRLAQVKAAELDAGKRKGVLNAIEAREKELGDAGN